MLPTCDVHPPNAHVHCAASHQRMCYRVLSLTSLTRTLFSTTRVPCCARGRLLPVLGFLAGAGQPPANFHKAQTPSRASAQHGLVMITPATRALGYRPCTFAASIEPDSWGTEWFKELNSNCVCGAGPGAWKMEEEAYWEALRSYTRRLARVTSERQHFELEKYFEARPDAKEAAEYRMMDNARRRRVMDGDAIVQQQIARQIDRDEAIALYNQANARYLAVFAIADGVMPGGRQALVRLVHSLLPEKTYDDAAWPSL
eukprot:scaffold7827_cov68-Phaeocystis_antarctica.AAC.2